MEIKTTVFYQYSHKDPENGTVYHPELRTSNGKSDWYMHNWNIKVSELGWLCDISEDELMMLKLKFGG
jgi:hypothetical protein